MIQVPSPRRIALAAGGTAGHVTPALAVAQAYRARCPGTGVLFLGSASGFEARLVAAHGFAFAALSAAPLHGLGTARRLLALAQLAGGVRQARRALASARIEVVIGFGGYASAGAMLGGRSRRLATVVHEANARSGLANRLLGRVVDRVCIAWPAAAAAFPDASRLRHTGMPIREVMAALAVVPREPPPPGRLRLLVCGGSQGSAFLNHHMPALAAALRAAGVAVEVWHQCGRHATDAVAAGYAACGLTARVDAHVDDMAAAYLWADAAIACAGAATLAELAAAGLPALLVPLAKASDDHQADNAHAYAAASGAVWVRETAWNAARLAAVLAPLARDDGLWRAWSAGARRLARPDAAAALVEVCEDLLRERATPVGGASLTRRGDA